MPVVAFSLCQAMPWRYTAHYAYFPIYFRYLWRCFLPYLSSLPASSCCLYRLHISVWISAFKFSMGFLSLYIPLNISDAILLFKAVGLIPSQGNLFISFLNVSHHFVTSGKVNRDALPVIISPTFLNFFFFSEGFS